MSRAKRNRDFIQSTGREITKLDRQQATDGGSPVTDERGDPVYEYVESGTVYAVDSGEGSGDEPTERSAGQSMNELRAIKVSDEVEWDIHTRFRLESGFEYAIQQPRPAKTGMRGFLLERVVE